MSELLWKKLNNQDFVAGLGALTGNQAVQEVDAGLEAIYLSGWQVAADANLSGEMYPSGESASAVRSARTDSTDAKSRLRAEWIKITLILVRAENNCSTS